LAVLGQHNKQGGERGKKRRINPDRTSPEKKMNIGGERGEGGGLLLMERGKSTQCFIAGTKEGGIWG